MSFSGKRLSVLALTLTLLAPLAANATSFETLASFSKASGSFPTGRLVFGSDGMLYGTAAGDGQLTGGSVFKFDPATATLTSLHDFKLNYSSPQTGVTLGPDGALYGTVNRIDTPRGVAYSTRGAVFKLATVTKLGVTTYKLTMLPAPCLQNCGLAPWPLGALVFGADGTMYGTTSRDALYHSEPSHEGSVFKFVPTISGSKIQYHQATTLHGFSGPDGLNPQGGVVFGIDGALYGTTFNSNGKHLGTVFRLDPGTGALTTLHEFSTIDGAGPNGSLLVGSDGMLYGMTQDGGPDPNSCFQRGCGTVFKLDPSSGTLTMLHAFSGPDGVGPSGGLIFGNDGALYGTTSGGGAGNRGTVFRLDPVSQTLTTLHAFSGSDGSNPRAGLVLGQDGALYGTTATGGSGDCPLPSGGSCGTLFKVVP